MAIAFPVKRWSGAAKPPPGTRVRRSHPLAAGLVAAWAFGEGGGERLADANERWPGVFQNGPTWIADRYGTAAVFDGTNDRIDLGGTQKITSSTRGTFWVRLRQELAASGAGDVFAMGGDGGGGTLELKINEVFGTSSYRMQVSDQTNVTETTSAVLVTKSVWHDLVWTGDGSAWAMWIDGVSAALEQSAGSNIGTWFGGTSPSGTVYTCFGARQFFGAFSIFFNGAIAAAALWDRVLSTSEVQQLSIDPFALYQPPVSLARRVVASAAAGAFQAAWAAHSNQILSGGQAA